MSNQDVAVTQGYHESTKLAYINLSNKPPLYKTYSGVPTFTLPSDFPEPAASALAAVSSSLPQDPSPRVTATSWLLIFPP